MSIINKKISLFFKRKSIHQLLWSYQSNFKGSGLVYKESRPYTAGDPYHRIDRRTSAKKQELYLKEFEEERMLRVLFVTQGGESMNFSSSDCTKRDILALLGLLVWTIALDQGDQISYYLHSWVDSSYIPLSKSAHQTKWFEQQLEKITFGWSTHAEETASLLNQYRIRHHLIIWVSDQLITTSQPHLQALAKGNDILYCHLLDPFEYDADAKHFWVTLLQVTDGLSSKTISPTDQKNYKEQITTKIAESERLLTSRWITATHASTKDDPLLICSKLFQKHALKKR